MSLWDVDGDRSPLGSRQGFWELSGKLNYVMPVNTLGSRVEMKYLERSSPQSPSMLSYSLFSFCAKDQPGAVDEYGLRQLEANFSKAKSRSRQLKAEMSELEQTAALQKVRVRTLESSIDDILADIKNLEDIQKSLPPGCYNTKAIELP